MFFDRWRGPLFCVRLRTLGAILIILGLILLILFVPIGIWLALLGAIMVIVGIFLRCLL